MTDILAFLVRHGEVVLFLYVFADQLGAWLDGPETPLVVDLRTALDVKAVPYAIPGAVRIAAEDLEQRHPDLPRDREIVLYCS